MLKISLAKREKYFVAAAVSVIGILLLFNFLVLPFFKAKDKLKRGIAVKEDEYKQIAALSTEYQKYQKGAGDVTKTLSKRQKGFSLATYLEDAARRSGLSLKEMTQSPSKSNGSFKESTVEMKLEGIATEQLVDYLYDIEKPENLIFISRISIGDNKKQEGYLDCTIRVLTYE